jgi:hypothetical protein
MIFGSTRDFDLLVNINRELLKDIVEQEVLYYKISLDDTDLNLYGESLEKVYYTPNKLNCLIVRGDQIIDVDDFGPDLNRDVSFAFIRRDLSDVNVVPETGDIIMWHEDYYEVDTVRENQLFLGRDNAYNLTNYGSNYGSSISITVDCHLTRGERVGIARQRV